MFDKAKEGVPRIGKFDPFANSSGYSSMNKVSKKQEPRGGPRKKASCIRKLKYPKKLWILNPKYVQKYKLLKFLPAHSHPVQKESYVVDKYEYALTVGVIEKNDFSLTIKVKKFMIKQLNRKERINLVPFPRIGADRLKMSVFLFYPGC